MAKSLGIILIIISGNLVFKAALFRKIKRYKFLAKPVPIRYPLAKSMNGFLLGKQKSESQNSMIVSNQILN
jgi:hypothetical protein